jgi:hypothetical protein
MNNIKEDIKNCVSDLGFDLTKDQVNDVYSEFKYDIKKYGIFDTEVQDQIVSYNFYNCLDAVCIFDFQKNLSKQFYTDYEIQYDYYLDCMKIREEEYYENMKSQ